MVAQVIVVGAGIGGLAVAHGLRSAGWSVVVLERAPVLAPVGAGLTLWPNALAALDALGVGEHVREVSAPIARAVTLAPDGRTLARIPLADLAARFEPLRAILRADLQRELVAALGAEAVRLGTEVARVDGLD